MSKQKCVIWDLDGTLADGRHRLHLLPKPEESHLDVAWAPFSLAADNDTPIQDNIDLMYALSQVYHTVILTGRGAIAEDVTKDWLSDNRVQYDELIMRPIGDCRLDLEFKNEEVDNLEEDYDVLCAFDDKASICELFRKRGITAHQVTDYEPVLVGEHTA